MPKVNTPSCGDILSLSKHIATLQRKLLKMLEEQKTTDNFSCNEGFPFFAITGKIVKCEL